MTCEHHRRHSRDSALRTQLAGDDLCGEEAMLLGVTALLGPTPVIAVAPSAAPADRWPPFNDPSLPPLQRRRVCEVFPTDEPPSTSSKGRGDG